MTYDSNDHQSPIDNAFHMVSYIHSYPNSSNSINHGHQEVPDVQIGPLVYEAKVRKWLNFHKISVRPPWSNFIITQKPKIIFTSIKSHWKANKIIYNFHVYTKTQFKAETWEKDART
ncbi:hypothetical protein MTR_5g059475 [Medicago truncatula]|uniref:Uncharacterized protein n=1 Tax=Medicago truncatula TaxID=3880 RepID=A0A072UQA4_MEDTR|nr:hypothetical protein MTR_5g059475 [Medicago truncatula]